MKILLLVWVNILATLLILMAGIHIACGRAAILDYIGKVAVGILLVPFLIAFVAAMIHDFGDKRGGA